MLSPPSHLPHDNWLHGRVLQQQLTHQVGSVTRQLAAGVTQLVDQRSQQRLLALRLSCQQPADGLDGLLLDEVQVVSAAADVNTYAAQLLSVSAPALWKRVFRLRLEGSTITRCTCHMLGC
jgi:hypothetical protein